MTSKTASIILPALFMLPLTVVAQQYTATDIGTLGGTTVSGAGINASGQVTGFSTTKGNSSTHAFLYSNGAMQDLGTLGGTTSRGTGINASGQVTGGASTAGDAATRAFIYSNGAMQDLGTLGGANSDGNGINANGEVTGVSDTGQGSHAFIYSDGIMQDLGTLPPTNVLTQTSIGNAIDASGQVAGYSSVPESNGTNHAFLFSDGSLHDLGTFGPSGTELNSQAMGINASGQVVGFAQSTPETSHAFLYAGGALQDLGTLGGDFSQALGINASGQVTGSSNLTLNGGVHAFLYSNGKMVDLNSLLSPSQAAVITLTVGNAINDSGQIVADGHDSLTSQNATFLLTPSTLPVPVVTLGAASLRFANQGANTSSAPQTVTLTNTGTAALGISSITLSGQFADDFVLTTTCGTSLEANASCALSVIFKPVSTGPKNATISIKDSAFGSPQSVAVAGMGVVGGPALKLSTTALTFVSQSIGMSAPGQVVTLTNSGSAALTLTSIGLKGGEADDFSFSKTCGASLAANASCALTVAFKPVSAGAKTATISIADNASGSPQLVTLSGTGVAGPRLKLSATELTFASQSVGTSSPSQMVTLTNTGTQTLILTKIFVQGGEADDFVLAKTCGLSLTVNASCTLTVNFKPVSAGAKAALINITDDVGGPAQGVSLSGGAVGGGAVKLSPAALMFASQAVGTRSAAQTVTLTNSGNAALTLTSIFVKGGEADDFSLAKTCGTSLPANGSCVLTVNFNPVSNGAKAAAINITDNANGSPQSVVLMGTGVSQ